MLPRERAGCGGMEAGWGNVANLDFILFLHKRGDIQAVRGRGLAMSRKSKGNVDWKPKEENAKQSEILFPLFLLCCGGVEKAGGRAVTPFHSPTPVQFSAHLAEQEHDAIYLPHEQTELLLMYKYHPGSLGQMGFGWRSAMPVASAFTCPVLASP